MKIDLKFYCVFVDILFYFVDICLSCLTRNGWSFFNIVIQLIFFFYLLLNLQIFKNISYLLLGFNKYLV